MSFPPLQQVSDDEPSVKIISENKNEHHRQPRRPEDGEPEPTQWGDRRCRAALPLNDVRNVTLDLSNQIQEIQKDEFLSKVNIKAHFIRK